MKKDDIDDEPSLQKIDDYNGTETPEKRNTIRLVIAGLIGFAIVYSFFNYKAEQSLEKQIEQNVKEMQEKTGTKVEG